MAAKTRHAGLTADERSTIRSTVLRARETIENDLYRQLERYGVYDDERVDINALGHLDAYDKQTRSQIDAALDRELEATDDDYERSVKNYVREATKTYLNRLVALKAIEVRGLVTETMIKRPEYGNRSEMHRTVDEVAGELTDQADNGLGVAVELAFTELTDEIGVIFEESEHTAIDLDFTVREEIIEQLNAIDVSVWESDEAMGWVYQYFGEKEREEIDDRIDEENYKVQDTDVATKTQLFTPRYIVEWMVDNSLGRLWLEMYGEETKIDDEDNCFYLSPLEESLTDRDMKDVRDIKVLDPACGSGHMLFYAFDVLYEMYLEQGDVAEKYIPREILANNLYGIDIDPGATQLAALALYVKAKKTEPDVEIERINIVSADAVLVNGKKKEEVLSRTDSDLERRVLEQVWTSFEHIREWGSLVRIEERIEEIIEEELDKIKATGQTKFTDDGIAKQSSVVSYSGDQESWEQVKGRLLDQVRELAEEALDQNDPIEEMFAGEVEKSVQLLDLFVADYDVVVSNPPYLGGDKMGSDIKKFVKDNYIGNRDLYTSFIQRCIELVGNDKYVAMVTMETFMYLYSYRKLRPHILQETYLTEATHIMNRDEGYMNVCFSIRKDSSDSKPPSRFNRLVNTDKKVDGLSDIIKKNRAGTKNENTYIIKQESFEELNRTPFVYWFGDSILSLFDQYDLLGDIATVKKGMGTGDDSKFVRKWWEVGNEELNKNYHRFQKSGTNAMYYDLAEDYVYWEQDGRAIKKHPKSNVRSESYYDKSGLNFRGFGSYFVAREHLEGMLFDANTVFIYNDNEHTDLLLLAILNSSISRYIMEGINPSPKFQVGDGKQLPIYSEINRKDDIKSLTEQAINSQREVSSLVENSSDFRPELIKQLLSEGPSYLLYKEEILQSTVQVIHGLIDNIIFEEIDLPTEAQNRIYNELPENLARYPGMSYSSLGSIHNKDLEKLEKEVSEQIDQKIIDDVDKKKNNEIRKISEDIGISPYVIAIVRHKYDLYTSDEKQEVAGRLLSYYLGCAMGRWELEGINSDDDGIIAFDSDFDDDVMNYIRRCIEITYGNEELYKRENEIEELLNNNIEDWLRNKFFRYHHCKQYRRRGQRIPIYWQLESDEGAFSCFVYYHSMNADTFPKLRGQYIDKKLDTLQNRLEAIERELDTAEDDRARELRTKKEELEVEIEDISEFRDSVDTLIDEGFEPKFEAGIWENIQKVDEHNLLAVPLDKL